jgi:hypothetical protein
VDSGRRNHILVVPQIAALPREADDRSRRAQDPTAAATFHCRRPWRRSRRRLSRVVALDAERVETGGRRPSHHRRSPPPSSPRARLVLGPAATVANADGSSGGREDVGGGLAALGFGAPGVALGSERGGRLLSGGSSENGHMMPSESYLYGLDRTRYLVNFILIRLLQNA